MSKNIDVFGNDLKVLKNKKLFLFDMDGTIYNDNNLFPMLYLRFFSKFTF